MDDIGLNCFPERRISYCQKHRNGYFRKFNKYISSDENEEKEISLLKKYQQDVKGPAFQVLTAVMFNLEKKFFPQNYQLTSNFLNPNLSRNCLRILIQLEMQS